MRGGLPVSPASGCLHPLSGIECCTVISTPTWNPPALRRWLPRAREASVSATSATRWSFPALADPRLHLAAVIISIHVLGQVALGFEVSVPQILSAILTCFVIELVWTFRQTGKLMWPASAMLTGSGVALILRVVGTERGDHWTWFGWYYFAAIAGLSLITKYVIRFRGSHVFNPSNVGLVIAFVVLGSAVIEPLDFWWAPLDAWMAAAYIIIITGGLLITARLRLLAMAVSFWLALGAGLGLLAASGHCFTASWSLQPVCGPNFWWVVMASPELLIFLFFMITDPKTIPARPTGRVAFAICLAVVCTLLMAPQVTEFGTKVGLLAGLVVMSPLRLVFDRVFQEEDRSQRARTLGLVNRLTRAERCGGRPGTGLSSGCDGRGGHRGGRGGHRGCGCPRP